MMDMMDDNLESNCKTIAEQIKALSKKSGKDVMGMIHEHMESEGDEEDSEAMPMAHRQPDEELEKQSEDAENEEEPEGKSMKIALIKATLKKKNKEYA